MFSTANLISWILVFATGISVLSEATAQEVFQVQEGELIIRFDDGSERPVVPSDTILYKKAFQNIAVEKGTVQPAEPYLPESIYFSMDVRTTQNKLNSLRQNLLDLRKEKADLEEQLEFARENPARIRPDDRVALSNRYYTVIDEISETEKLIGSTTKNLASLKRLWHKNVLAKLPLPRILPLTNIYDFGAVQFAENRVDSQHAKKEQEVIWEPPEDIPMPIIPHPSTVDIENRYRNPPQSPCSVSSQKKNSSDELHIVTDPQELFFFLPEEMRVHRRGRPMISGDIRAERIHRGVFLRFDFTLHIPAARRSFGGLPNHTPIRIELLTGEIVNLNNVEANTGTFDDRTNTVFFTALTPLSLSQEKLLRSTEATKIRVGWTTGHEDYEIYNITLIRDQLDCLDHFLIKN